MYVFPMQNQCREMRVRFKASSEEQQMGDPCVSGEAELTASVPG